MKRIKKNILAFLLLNMLLNLGNCYSQSIKNIEWISGDLLDISFCEDLLTDNTLLYHCAAQVSFNKKEAELIYKSKN